MAAEIRRKSVTIPALTTVASGFTADLSFPARVVREVQVVVPPGPRGEVGWRLGAAGVPVIPIEPLGWVITDDEVVKWPLEGLWDSGSWTLFAYNTGRYPHTLQIRFLVDLAGARDSLAQPLDPAALATVVSSDGGAAAPSGAAPAPFTIPVAALPVAALPAPPALSIVQLPAPTAPGPGSAGPTVVTSSVADWYQSLLGRPADPAGVAFWLSLSIDHGGPLSFPALVARFCSTAEAQADALAAPQAFVAGLYAVLLGRSGAASEIAYWATRLRGPTGARGDLSAQQVAQQIAASGEAQSDYAAVQVQVVA